MARFDLATHKENINKAKKSLVVPTGQNKSWNGNVKMIMMIIMTCIRLTGCKRNYVETRPGQDWCNSPLL